ncbi:hexosaminidase D-like isoform X2 [Cloeon dipterum]|uniref:hexosaminidase D-like isoform X2 n=1 Tax=Cloeon dipterum TaxID=197152 RepID=UPI0032208C23
MMQQGDGQGLVPLLAKATFEGSNEPKPQGTRGGTGQQSTWAQRVGSAVLYCAASLLITLSNKIVLTSFDFPSAELLGLCQLAATVAVLTLGRLLKVVRVPPLSGAVLRVAWPLPCLFLANLLFGLAGTKSLSLPIFIALRRFTIVMTMLAEVVLLRTMSMAKMLAGRVGLTAWRRRSTWLGLMLVVMVLLVCLQFYSEPTYLRIFNLVPPKSHSSNLIGKDNRNQDKVHASSYSAKVEVSTPYVEGNEVQRNYEEEQRAANAYFNMPSRDDIYNRRQQTQETEKSKSGTTTTLSSTTTKNLNNSMTLTVKSFNTTGNLINTAASITVSSPTATKKHTNNQTASLTTKVITATQRSKKEPDYLEQQGITRVALNPKNPYIPPHRLVHFDLKGAPPKMTYLLQLLPIFKQLGATGVLLEWEDMFPFKGPLASVAALNHYTEEEVIQLLTKCKELGLEVIPLVQTFGHLEFVLKIEQFSNLRELPDIPQALCPSKNSSFKMVTKLLHQVYELHSKVTRPRYIHIGCDEVFTMGECDLCRKKARDDVFLDHVAKVAGFVRSQFNATPIIWDDMLRHLMPDQLRKIGDLVEPMVWVYAENVYHFVQTSVWDKYASSFPTAWTASAFKGAFGETINVPNAKRHLENNLRWLEVMTNENRKFRGGFSGIVITGWQRYDHFATLCELLPSGLPSLALDMLATSRGYFNQSLRSPLDSAMNCPASSRHMVSLDRDAFLWERFSSCAFPGAAVFRVMSRLENLERDTEEFLLLVRKKKAWLTDYNVRHNFTTPLRLNELMQDHSRLQHSALSVSKQARDALSEVFDQHTVGEWLEQKMQPLLEVLERVGADSTALRRRIFWPVRPLPQGPALRKFGIDLH